MTLPVLTPTAPDPALGGIIKLAVLAVGGQGGGVLTGWVEDVARAHGYAVQATSVAGVAQRTGSTLYYIEMCPASGDTPVFSLMPAAGDVDIMIAAEMMEAGRSIIRGFVTPDRTTLITSTHRALAVSEKTVPGDGIASSAEVAAAAEIAARRVIAADFDAIATKAGSVISASLLGALAASGALPFAKPAFEAAISGKGADASLQAFRAGYDASLAPVLATAAAAKPVAKGVSGPQAQMQEWQNLIARADRLPADVATIARLGLQKVVDFQDIAYGADYLARLETLLALDTAAKAYAFTIDAAKYVANAMAYDDVIRVADIKTRKSRQTRIADEMGGTDANLIQLTEYLHPRAEEIIGMMPAGLGARLDGDPKWHARLNWLFNKGRHLRTDRLPAFLMLYALCALKPRRRRSYRHATEMAHLTTWLATATGYLAMNYDLACEVIKSRRLIKGYSDTHARGLSKFDLVLAGIARIAKRDDAADWARRLREAALQDEGGTALSGALQTIESFA